MKPYQERVVEEYKELGEKLHKLTFFIKESPSFKEVDVPEQTRLIAQQKVMEQYHAILNDRICNFK